MTDFVMPTTVHGLALDSRGERIVAVGPNVAVIYDTSAGHPLLPLEGPIGHAYDVDFAPDDQSVAVCFHGGHVRRYDADTGKILTKYEGHAGVPHGVRKVAFHPGGELLASVAEDSTLRIWDVESGAQVNLFKDRADVNSVAWWPGEDRVAFASDVGLSLVDIHTRKGRARDTRPIAEIQIVEDRVYTAWGEAIRVLDGNLDIIGELPQADVSRLRVADELLYAASWQGEDRGVRVWHLPTKTERSFEERSEIERQPQVWGLALDRDRDLIYAGVTPTTGVSSGLICWSSLTQ